MKLLFVLSLALLAACQGTPVEKPQSRRSISAEINKSFRDPKFDIRRWLKTFESESREVFEHRKEIAELLGLKPGMDVADIGAGTGFLSLLFAKAVGPKGVVYAVELSPGFLKHLTALRRTRGVKNIAIVECDERKTHLAPRSIDLAFVCDTYHHFEYHQDTLRSIHQALRPGGELVVLDFERIPGVSREFLIKHVRAGKEVFRKEILDAGFVLVREEKTPFLKENYVLRFRRGR